MASTRHVDDKATTRGGGVHVRCESSGRVVAYITFGYLNLTGGHYAEPCFLCDRQLDAQTAG